MYDIRQINTLILEVLMQGVVVVDRRGLTAVGATRRARGYMKCMRGSTTDSLVIGASPEHQKMAARHVPDNFQPNF